MNYKSLLLLIACIHLPVIAMEQTKEEKKQNQVIIKKAYDTTEYCAAINGCMKFVLVVTLMAWMAYEIAPYKGLSK